MTPKTEDNWDERFGPTIDTDDGSTMWPAGDEYLTAIMERNPHRVWSVVEADNENQYLVPGSHVVNVIGFVIASREITEAELASGDWNEVLWFDASQVVRLTL